jgi:integrase
MVESTSRMAKTSVPGIYRLPSGLFLVRIRMRFGAASLTFKSMSSAKRWQRATAIGLEDGTLAIYKGVVMPKEEMLRQTSQIITVTQAIERFTQSSDCKVKPGILRLINEGLGELAVAEVDKAAIVHFLDAYSEGKAPSTRNRYISGVSSVMKFCAQRDWIDHNPASLIKKQSEAGNERDRVITVEEEAALRDACDEQDRVLGHIFVMLMATGSRISEITGMRWRDVDMKNKTIRLSSSSTKNKQARTLFIAGRAWERLEEHSKVRPISDDSLVFPYYTGAEYPATRAFRKASNSIGYDWFIPHLTRHTWASRVSAMPGMTVQRLCQLAGWSSWQMAQRYAHAMQSDNHDVMAQLAEQYQ